MQQNTTLISTPLEPVYYAFDPGPTLGWARFGSTGETQKFGQIPGLDAQAQWLETLTHRYDVLVVIYERYIIDARQWDHNGDEAETAQSIGVIKSWAYRNHLRLVGSHRRNRKVGLAYGQLKEPSNHKLSHQVDAQAHGIFWLTTNNIRKHPMEL